jgi:hypothetical protein
MSMWRQARFLTLALALGAACYRDSPPPRGEPLQLLPPECRGADDSVQQPLDREGGGTRLRSHVDGSLSGADNRRWTGDPVPRFIPTKIDALELFLLDDADGGHLAFYREPYDVGSCPLSGHANCGYEARFYKDKRLIWSLHLNDFLSREDYLEIQDIRLAGGVLYFNEACQSYASGVGGKCSSLVAIDTRTRQVLWRTSNLVSNNRFLVRGCFVVAGYGFTAERDFVHLVDRRTGVVAQKVAVSSAPQQLALVDRDKLDIVLYSGGTRRFRLVDIERHTGKLESLDGDIGGDSYGGNIYGGSSYGGGASYRLKARKGRPLKMP